jgi:hypothetical protein
MTKLILLFCLLAFFVSCNPADCDSQASQQTSESAAACPLPEPNPDPGPDHGEVPNEAIIFDIKADLYDFDRDDEDKVYKAFDVIKKIVASREFRNRVINFTYQGKKQFVDNMGLSNEEIYQKLLDGREDLKPKVDHIMDLELQLYYSFRSTVGYTYPNDMRVYMNTKFFDSYTPSEVAGNVFHEWTHKLGFEHDSSYSVSRDSSVPYAIGYIIEELGKQYQ